MFYVGLLMSVACEISSCASRAEIAAMIPSRVVVGTRFSGTVWIVANGWMNDAAWPKAEVQTEDLQRAIAQSIANADLFDGVAASPAGGRYRLEVSIASLLNIVSETQMSMRWRLLDGDRQVFDERVRSTGKVWAFNGRTRVRRNTEESIALNIADAVERLSRAAAAQQPVSSSRD
jgi:hypothetical protein